MPNIRPRAGHDLLTGIDSVLSRLDTPEPDGDGAAEFLLIALVRCAACGDIPQVRAQADAVRFAAALLRDGMTERAVLMLKQARMDLLP
ncbi:hypothetical protein BU204_27350 [Actinophytocola xanthii]|uniref:Uncharacterized protein n=1 Tax=Actinophytocola xanthii TaxID=1912961 RepID=A0A1Q8CGC1_9PSEU|nr:hypothetical protein BU204_27350 [Actinophytocola xanthii]